MYSCHRGGSRAFHHGLWRGGAPALAECGARFAAPRV